jgi:phospholipase/carboxylesterase
MSAHPSLDPHGPEPVLHEGPPLEEAAGLVILLHGRNGNAENILQIVPAMHHPRLAYLAPEAAGHSWYPNSFLAPRETNVPWLSSALTKVAALVALGVEAGIPTERIVIGGFSQGACLTSEFVATHPARYAGIIAFTGGLIGPLGADISHAGDLAGTPAFFGAGDPDPHVPWSRVQETAAVLTTMGAAVTLKRYPGKPHSVSAEEMGYANGLIQQAFQSI